MNSAMSPASQSASNVRTGHAATRSLGTRVWQGLVEAGQRRAAADLARHVRLHGGRPTGNLAQDAQQLAALRGLH